MKTIKLVLPDQIHQIALDLASAEGVEVGQFSAGLLSDALLAVSQTHSENTPTRPATTSPPDDVTEMDLITAIIDVLKPFPGGLTKSDAEHELFSKFHAIFEHPYYQEEVGDGVKRWRKNVQFARNTACNTLGLIKTPQEAGRGVWELTDKGRAWVRS